MQPSDEWGQIRPRGGIRVVVVEVDGQRVWPAGDDGRPAFPAPHETPGHLASADDAAALAAPLIERLGRIEATLGLILARETAREHYSIEEFAKIVS